MYDGGKIIAGIIIFLAFALFPFYSNIGKADIKPPKPSLDTPVIKALKVKKCVEPEQYMRESHMQLLIKWRDSALRHAKRVYVNSNGEEYVISLQKTCLRCHSNRSEFCDRCHKYADVDPYCWDCHFSKAKQEEQR